MGWCDGMQKCMGVYDCAHVQPCVHVSWGPCLTKGATISNPARPQVVDSGTARRYRS